MAVISLVIILAKGGMRILSFFFSHNKDNVFCLKRIPLYGITITVVRTFSFFNVRLNILLSTEINRLNAFELEVARE